jgi:hypothetical protein
LGFLDDLLDEVGSALRLRQAGTTDMKSENLFNAGDHDIDPRMLGKTHGLEKLDLTVLDGGLIGRDFHRQTPSSAKF